MESRSDHTNNGKSGLGQEEGRGDPWEQPQVSERNEISRGFLFLRATCVVKFLLFSRVSKKNVALGITFISESWTVYFLRK